MRDKSFLQITCLLSTLISLLYVWKGFEEGFIWITWLIVIANLIYIPIVLILKQKGFYGFYVVYALIVMTIGGFYPAELCNNFTSLFMIVTLVAIRPRYKLFLIVIYCAAVTTIFAIQDETLNHYLIHLARACWFYNNIKFFILQNYQRKKLTLTPDEELILKELNEKKMIKACDSFSKNTITEKLRAARERNNCANNAQLLAEYNLTNK